MYSPQTVTGQPAILTLSATANPITCFNGTTATLAAGGGLAPYQYSWIADWHLSDFKYFSQTLAAGNYTFKIRM
jgi:hypothetical protein